MSHPLKRIFLSITFNLSLFVILIIGIQNSINKSRVNLIINKTVDLPISFIIGTSFIGGSLSGSLIFIYLNFQNKRKISS